MCHRDTRIGAAIYHCGHALSCQGERKLQREAAGHPPDKEAGAGAQRVLPQEQNKTRAGVCDADGKASGPSQYLAGAESFVQ